MTAERGGLRPVAPEDCRGFVESVLSAPEAAPEQPTIWRSLSYAAALRRHREAQKGVVVKALREKEIAI